MMRPSLMWTLILFSSVLFAAASPKDKEKLVVILIDGFRWDYVDHQSKDVLPAFYQFREEGVRAKWVNPIFPALSYPSWTTLSTGLYAENHNIIGNYFYDVSAGDTFELFNSTSTSLDKWWRHAEPIWITATRKGLKVATILWARSDIPYKRVSPASPQGFTETKGWQSFDKNLNNVINKLKDGFDLIMVYVEHVDNFGHRYGPNSRELQEAVRQVDAVLLSFLDKLDKEDLDDEVNVMVVSDHGMAAGDIQSGMKYVSMKDYVDMHDIIHIVDRGAVSLVYPVPGREETVYKNLKEMRGVNVYLKHEIPDEYHYKNGRYVPEVLVVAKPGYFIEGDNHMKNIPRDPLGLIWNGFHGYGQQHPDMRTIFMAKGPSFNEKYQGDPIDLVDIYQMYAHVLKIKPQPHNGTWENVRLYLKNDSTRAKFEIIPLVLGLVALVRLY